MASIFELQNNMNCTSLLAEVSICAGNSKEKRPLPRSQGAEKYDCVL